MDLLTSPNNISGWRDFPENTNTPSRRSPIPMRYTKRAFVLLIAVAGLGIGSWYGVRALRFERARAAAESARAGFDFQKERAELQECLRLRPDNPPLLLLAASAARRDGDLADAERNLGRYRELTAGTTPEGLLQETLLRTVSGPLEKDVEYLIALADRRQPPHPREEIFEALTVGSNTIYQLERTRFWIEQLSKHYPRNAIGRLIRAQLDETLNKRESAEEECRRILADFPAFDRARLFLASMLGRRQKYYEAVEQFKSLRGRRPDDVAVLLGLVGCLERLGQTRRGAAPRTGTRRTVSGQQRGIASRRPHRDSRTALAGCRAPPRPSRQDRPLRLRDPPGTRGVPLSTEPPGRGATARRAKPRNRGRPCETRWSSGRGGQDASRSRAAREAGRICIKNGQSSEGLRWLVGALEFAPDHKPTHEALAEYYAARGDLARAKHHRALAQ